jgi:HSP20 family protein
MSLGRRGFEDLWQMLDEGLGREAPWPAGGYSAPSEIFEHEDRVVVRMDLAGVDPKNVEVTTQEGALVVNARRDFPYDADEVRFLRRGIFYGQFTNRVQLGDRYDAAGITARYDNGVLELSIPHRAEVKPRRISIETTNPS